MRFIHSTGAGRAFVWTAIASVMIAAFVAATMSPQLQWREPIYIAAGFAGIFALAFLLLQPLLAAHLLPGLSANHSRRAHRWIGGSLILAVLAHVLGLWITSPPDVIDALLFRSPTWFSVWGVIAMWAIFASGVIALLRRRIHLRLWRRAHTFLGVIIAGGTIAHALLIEGTMEPITKALLCLLLGLATFKAVIDLKC